MTRIESVSSCVVRVPLDKVTSFATRTVSERHYLLVNVRGDDGGEGIGFCYLGNRAGALGALAVRELLAPVLLGQDPQRVEGLWAEMYGESVLHGRAGTVMRALSALDIALWDRNARAAGLPLARYLGGGARDTVPAYASGGYYLEGKSHKSLGEELAGYAAQGFAAVKMKVGRLSPKEEEDRIAAAREALDPEVLLLLDANNAWPDLPTALRYMERYESYDPYWIEEPFGVDDIDNHARLAEHTPVTVATGEIEAGRWRFLEILEKGAAGILQPDAAVCGGITEFRRIAQTAASFGVPLCPHWFHDLHVHLVAAIPNGQFVEYFPDDQVLNFRRLLDRQLELRNGALVVPTDPGLGFDFDNKAVETYTLVPWAETK
ncbi:MAG: mandelate racemase/muconate lactonizing enzyme family protein [Kiloniellaceae bacterium]